MSDKKIAFIGTGNMSYAIIGGMLKKGFKASQVIATNRNPEKLAKVENDLGVVTQTDNFAAIRDADYVVLSVKPQMMADLCQAIAQNATEYGYQLSDKIFISVAAGITAARFAEMFGAPITLVRCMPNTPSLMGLGVSGLYAKDLASEHRDFTTQVFSSTGIAKWLESEDDINDIIAVTGSSPAYFFLFMEAIEKKAIDLGFSPEDARALVQQTALGAAHMVAEQTDSIATLRANVTSKGGTTHEAVEHLKRMNLDGIVADAMDNCIARAKEMEQEL